jgi:hypothetical protein
MRVRATRVRAMRHAARGVLVGAVVTSIVSCGRERPPAAAAPDTAIRFAVADTAGTSPDTTLAARGASPPLEIVLPPPPGGPLDDRARELADLAVFDPRTSRHFIARRVDSIEVAADIGRLDASPGPGDSAAVARMLAAASPVQPGLRVVVHDATGSDTTEVTIVTVSGRRIVATAHLARVSTQPWAVMEVLAPRASTAGDARASAGTAARSADGAPSTHCTLADSAAVRATIDRLLAGARTGAAAGADVANRATSASRDDEATRGSAVIGCFGAWRAVVVRRPVVATPDATERAWLVSPTGAARTARLRDLSYPLHDLLGTLDLDADGVDELLVRSHRTSMETIAALRMTDSVTFTRVVNGYTVERR